MSAINGPGTGPLHRARLPILAGLVARVRRNAAHETSPVVLHGPFNIDRATGKQTIAHDGSLRVSQNKLGLNPLPARRDLKAEATLGEFIAAHNRLLADMRAKGMMGGGRV